MGNLLWTLKSRKSKFDFLGPSVVFEFIYQNFVEPVDRLWNFTDAARSWNCRKSTLELSCGNNRSTLEFYGRCSTLELSKIDFGIVEYANGQDCQEKSQ